MHAASVHAGRDVIGVLPLPPCGAGARPGPAAELTAFSPGAAFEAGVQLDPRPVALGIGVQQHVRRGRLLFHQLLAVQRGAARRHRRQTRHVILRGRKGGVFTVT